MAKTCAWRPTRWLDFCALNGVAQRCVTDTENHARVAGSSSAKGLTDFRGGHHAEAIEWLQRLVPMATAPTRMPPSSPPWPWHITNLATPTQVRVSLDSARAIIAKKPPDWMRTCPYWLHCEILFREAEGLIAAVSPQEAAELLGIENKH